MLATLAIVVFFSSIVVFFSSELMSTIKAMLLNRSFRILAPLILGSWFVIEYKSNFLWILVTCRIGLFHISQFLNSFLPFGNSLIFGSKIIEIYLLSISFIVVSDIIEKSWKRITKLRIFAEYISPYVWLITAFLYVVGVSGDSLF